MNENTFPSRREFLSSTSFGIGAAALTHLLGADGARADRTTRTDTLPREAQRPARAKSMILLV